MQTPIPSHLSDEALTAEVGRLARCERETSARLVAHLAEFDARRLYRAAGYPSLFAYCTECLHISEYGAYNRMEAARAARRFPVLLEMLSDGALNLTTVRILAPHLTGENHRALLEEAGGRSKREVEQLIAFHFPQPAMATLVRRLPARGRPAPASAGDSPFQTAATAFGASSSVAPLGAPIRALQGSPVPPDPPVAESSPVPSAALPEPLPSGRRPTVTPLAPDRYQIRFTASAETHRKLRQAQELLGHAVPNGDVAVVIDRALSALVAELLRKKAATTERPGASRNASSAGSRHIPAQVRRTVWQRDGGRCAFVARSGLRCSARRPLEFHHVHPYGAGGPATAGNIELRCRSHNAYESELFYGVKHRDGGNGIVREPSARYGTSDRSNSPRGEFARTRARPAAVGPG